jgi:ubiquinone/menaquinone biosynthesis C-methylase UbiE
MSLRAQWEAHADAWIDWARAPGHDSYWRFHRDQFLRLVPASTGLTIDIGCGEGRLTRHLKSLGHTVIGIDASPSLVAAARASDPSMAILQADATALPLADNCADLAIAFMSLHDIDAIGEAVGEVARVVKPGGCFCVAIVHPINSAGKARRQCRQCALHYQGRLSQVLYLCGRGRTRGAVDDVSRPSSVARELFFRVGSSRICCRGAARAGNPG